MEMVDSLEVGHSEVAPSTGHSEEAVDRLEGDSLEVDSRMAGLDSQEGQEASRMDKEAGLMDQDCHRATQLQGRLGQDQEVKGHLVHLGRQARQVLVHLKPLQEVLALLGSAGCHRHRGLRGRRGHPHSVSGSGASKAGAP